MTDKRPCNLDPCVAGGPPTPHAQRHGATCEDRIRELEEALRYIAGYDVYDTKRKARRSKPPRAASAALLDVADAAIVWWAMKRPFQWSLEQHLANPHINTSTPSEKRLADAAAAWCALQATA